MDKNTKISLFATTIFLTKTTEEWEASTYEPEKGELVFSEDIVDPMDPGTSVVRAKLGQGGLKWNQLPFWNTDNNSLYRPIKILTESDFAGNEYVNIDWAGLMHYQVIYQGVRLKEQITKKITGGFQLNSGFELFGNELMVIF